MATNRDPLQNLFGLDDRERLAARSTFGALADDEDTITRTAETTPAPATATPATPVTPVTPAEETSAEAEEETSTPRTPDEIAADMEEARETYEHRTHGAGSVARKAVSILLGAATAGLVGLDYALKANAYKDAQYAAEYNAQIAEYMTEAVESLHQAGLGLGNTGHPMWDNQAMELYFPNMTGFFTENLKDNPELAEEIYSRFNESLYYKNDVLDAYAQSRGYEDYMALQSWAEGYFAHMFNSDGTVAVETTISQLNDYYTIMADMYNYVGDEAIAHYSEELFMHGLNQEALEGIKFVTTEIKDEAGNIISTELSTEVLEGAINVNAQGWDTGDTLSALAVTAIAGIGAYLIGDKIMGYFANKNAAASATPAAPTAAAPTAETPAEEATTEEAMAR